MLKIPNWRAFQGYQKRGPPWVKLHVSLLRHKFWPRLSLLARATLPGLWIVASEQSQDGTLDSDPVSLAHLLSMRESELVTALKELKSFGFIDSDESVADSAMKVSHQTEEEVERETETETRGVVVKAGPTAAEIEATKRLLGRGELPTGTPMKFAHESPRPSARLTPKDLGFQTQPAAFCQQNLAWAITRLVEARKIADGGMRRKAAVELLWDASRTPKGVRIDTPENLKNIPEAWAKITLDRLVEIARDVYAIDDGVLFEART